MARRWIIWEIILCYRQFVRVLIAAISVWFQKDKEPFIVKLYADKIATKFLKRRPLPTQTFESLNENGSSEIVVKITHEMEILPFVKYWMPHIHILEPKSIRDMIQKYLESYLEDLKNI